MNVNFFNEVHHIQEKCFDNIKTILNKYVNNPNIINEVNNEIFKAFTDIDAKYINDYNNFISINNNNNVPESNSNDSEEEMDMSGDSECDSQSEFDFQGLRRKFFVLFSQKEGIIKQIVEYLPTLEKYVDHSIRRQRVDAQLYNYWILVEFSAKRTLRNDKVFNTLYNYKANSKKQYEKFMENHGEPFHF
jgi:hypothetical protein